MHSSTARHAGRHEEIAAHFRLTSNTIVTLPTCMQRGCHAWCQSPLRVHRSSTPAGSGQLPVCYQQHESAIPGDMSKLQQPSDHPRAAPAQVVVPPCPLGSAHCLQVHSPCHPGKAGLIGKHARMVMSAGGGRNLGMSTRYKTAAELNCN